MSVIIKLLLGFCGRPQPAQQASFTSTSSCLQMLAGETLEYEEIRLYQSDNYETGVHWFLVKAHCKQPLFLPLPSQNK